MIAFFLDWNMLAAIAALGSMLGGVWLRDRRERRLEASEAAEWQTRVGKLERRMIEMRSELRVVERIVLKREGPDSGAHEA